MDEKGRVFTQYPVSPGKRKTTRYQALVSVSLLAVAVTSIVGSVVFFSGQKPMWLDEMFTYFAVKHDSFGALFESYGTGINAAPPLFFLLAFVFTKIFGLSAFTLRLFSALCFAGSLPCLWSLLRRRFSLLASAFSLFGVVCTSQLVLTQSMEARYYGLYFLLAAVFLWTIDQYYNKSGPDRAYLFLAFGASALFCWSFYLGIAYCGATLFVLVLGDALSGRLRWPLYLAIVGGMSSLTICLPWLLHTTQAPGWIGRLSPTALLTAGESGVNFHFLIFLFALATAPRVFALGNAHGANWIPHPLRLSPADFRLLWMATAFILVPVAIWICSRFANPLMVDRYLIVSNLGYVILLGFVAQVFFSGQWQISAEKLWIERVTHRTSMIFSFAATFLLTAYPLFSAAHTSRQRKMESFEYSLPLTEPLPIASCGAFSYFPRMFLDAYPSRYTLVTRTEAESNTWRKFNRLLQSVSLEQYLKTNKRFYVVSEGLDKPFMVDAVTMTNGSCIPISCAGGAKLWLVELR